jgi:hypothetical protein
MLVFIALSTFITNPTAKSGLNGMQWHATSALRDGCCERTFWGGEALGGRKTRAAFAYYVSKSAFNTYLQIHFAKH